MHRTALLRIAAAGTVLATGIAVAVTTGTAPAQSAEPDGWHSIGSGTASGISGIAVTERTVEGFDALVVRDNKLPGENRIARVAHRAGANPRVEPLTWEGGDEPIDLEAIDQVPGTPDEYVAVASEGIGYHLKVTEGAAEVLDLFPLPAIAPGDNFENFALTSPSQDGNGDGELVAVWADRGEDDRPGTLYAAPLSFGEYDEAIFGPVRTAQVRAPYPAEDVRHASDLTITASGDLLVSSASDPGDTGPFDSAVYVAGHVGLDSSGAVRLTAAEAPRALETFQGHKIEALDCLPDSPQAALGTDDEASGGALTTAPLCER